MRAILPGMNATDHDIQFVDVDEPDEGFTLAAFAEANEESPELPEWLDAMMALSPGETISLGGGAAPLTTLRRVS